MAAQGNIFGISAGSGTQSVITMDLSTLANIAAAQLIEMRILNKNTVAAASGFVVTDDPNQDRLDAAAAGLYANPPVLPSPGQ